jgi:hypothetical protein
MDTHLPLYSLAIKEHLIADAVACGAIALLLDHPSGDAKAFIYIGRLVGHDLNSLSCFCKS